MLDPLIFLSPTIFFLIPRPRSADSVSDIKTIPHRKHRRNARFMASNRTAYDVSVYLSTHAIGSYTTYYKYTQRQSSVPCTQQLYIHFALSLRSSRRAASLRQITCMYYILYPLSLYIYPRVYPICIHVGLYTVYSTCSWFLSLVFY